MGSCHVSGVQSCLRNTKTYRRMCVCSSKAHHYQWPVHNIITGQYAYHRISSKQGASLGEIPPCSGSLAHHTDYTYPRAYNRLIYHRTYEHTEQKRVCGTSVYRHNAVCNRRAPTAREMDESFGHRFVYPLIVWALLYFIKAAGPS